MTAQLALPALLLLGSPAARVEAVRIEAPARDAERLARYLVVTAGSALDPAAVRRSVELLFATEEFEDVQAVAEPSGTGVTLVFRTVPAPRMTALELRGDLVMTEKEVRRVARLRWFEPLWPARLERVAQDLGLSLVERGYLEGRADAVARRVPGGAVAVVEVSRGPRARVRQVRLEGAPPELAPQLNARLRPRPGEVYSRGRATAAADALRRLLAGFGRWRAEVEPVDVYDPATARVDLVFRVSAGPRCSVAFQGFRIRGDLRRELETRLRDGRLRGDALEEVADRLEAELWSRGHRSARVSHRENAGLDSLQAVFEIEAGPAAEVASVEVVGAEAAELRGLPLARPGTPLRDAALEQEARALERALVAQGWSAASVEPDAREGGGPIPVVFRVRKGARSLVKEVRIEGGVGEIDSPQLRTQTGQPFRAFEVAQDRNLLVGAFRDVGFLQAEVRPEVAFSEDRSQAEVVFGVETGPRTLVDRVVVAGLRRTREQVVRRDLLLQEGEPLGLGKALKSQRRLASLGIFQRVDFRELDPEAADARAVVVALEEASQTAVSYGLGYAERDLLRASAEVTRRNLWGMDRSLTSFARISFRGSRLLASYTEPRLFGRRQDLFLTGFREEEDREAFDYVRYGSLVQTARPLTRHWSLILRYAYQLTDTFNLSVPPSEIDRRFQSSTFSGPSASLVHDTRDDPLDARRGVFLGSDLQVSAHALGGDSFVKGFVQASAYRPFGARATVTVNGRLGLAGTFASEPPRLPLPDRFFLGGDYGLRGYEIDTAGPLEPTPDGTLVPTGGNALVFAGVEARFDAARHLSLAVFAETGNVFPLTADFDLGELLYTAGLGVRYKTPVGPVRVDWGYKLNRRPGEKPYQWHFTVGHAF